MRGFYRIKREIYKVRRRFVPGALILMYHRVTNLANDPYLLAVSPENFNQQLDYIKSTCYVMPLLELNEAIQKGNLPNRAVAITFDDGYIDVLEQAYPILKSKQLPATVFVTSGQIGSQREFWWDDLERVLLLPDNLPKKLDLTIQGQKYQWDLLSLDEKEKVHGEVFQLIKPLKNIERMMVLDQLADWAGVGESGRTQYRTMEKSEIVQLVQDNLIEIGAHTVTHPMLSLLASDEQKREIISGRKKLEEIIDNHVQSFAYPYGKVEDYSNDSVEIVSTAGFSLGCTSICGSIEVGDDIYQLSRCGIHNWEIDTFIRKLEDFFIFRN